MNKLWIRQLPIPLPAVWEITHPTHVPRYRLFIIIHLNLCYNSCVSQSDSSMYIANCVNVNKVISLLKYLVSSLFIVFLVTYPLIFREPTSNDSTLFVIMKRMFEFDVMGWPNSYIIGLLLISFFLF